MWKTIRADFRRHGFGHGGSWALLFYRFGRWSLQRRTGPVRWTASKVYGLLRPVFGRLSGVYLERETRIGSALHIIHAGMVHIHPGAIIGDRVGIMHGVTIGTNMSDEPPTIGDDVFIGCNASVLGAVTVGNGARIAANSLVITDVPAGAVAIGVPARVVRELGALGKREADPQRAASIASSKRENFHTRG